MASSNIGYWISQGRSMYAANRLAAGKKVRKTKKPSYVSAPKSSGKSGRRGVALSHHQRVMLALTRRTKKRGQKF